jgi:thymidylate synthase (FAD)
VADADVIAVLQVGVAAEEAEVHMGKFVEPEVFILAETKMNYDDYDPSVPGHGFYSFLKYLGVPNWETDAESPAEKLMEVAGKLCYLSFSTDLNKNLTKVGARSNYDYLQQGIIATKHGSVLEHATVTIAFMDVSRVFTHELVRHRPGSAYSQVSGRYVRTDSVDMFLPTVIAENEAATKVFQKATKQMEDNVMELVQIFKIDEMRTKEQFSLKKILTSAFRRIIGNGQANHIIATYNHRSLRHILEVRTSQHAEEEIRIAFYKLFKLVKAKYPAIYGDAKLSDLINGIPEVTFEHSKV